MRGVQDGESIQILQHDFVNGEKTTQREKPALLLQEARENQDAY
jgi:hypothetical protein